MWRFSMSTFLKSRVSTKAWTACGMPTTMRYYSTSISFTLCKVLQGCFITLCMILGGCFFTLCEMRVGEMLRYGGKLGADGVHERVDWE
jgi:hypothetical protein